MLKKLTPLVFASILILSPLAGHAITSSELQAQIASLIAQINALQRQQLNPSSSGTVATSAQTTPSCIMLTRTLSLDDTDLTKGGDVTKLQQFLVSQGPAIYPEARVTGYFGPATQRAVQHWQLAHGLASVERGIVGARTRAAISCGTTTTTTVTTPVPVVIVPNTIVPTVVSPTIPSVIPVPVTSPTCAITSDRSSYNLGETITFSWTSKNATTAGFVADTSGKDNLSVPGDKLEANGSQRIIASVYGNPSVTLKVLSPTGSGTCTKSVSVVQPSMPTVPVLPAYAKSSYTYSGLVGMFSSRSGSSYTTDNQLISKWAWSSSGNTATVRFLNAANGYYEDFAKSGDWIVLKGWGAKSDDGKNNLYYTIDTTKAIVTLNGTQYDITSQFKGGMHPYALEAVPASNYSLYVEGVLHESVDGVPDGRTLNFAWNVDWTHPDRVNTVFLGGQTGIIQSEDFIEYRSPQVETRQVQAICDGYGYQCYMKLNSGLEGGLRP